MLNKALRLIVSTMITSRDNFGDFEIPLNQSFDLPNKYLYISEIFLQIELCTQNRRNIGLNLGFTKIFLNISQ